MVQISQLGSSQNWEAPLFHPCQVRTYHPVPLLDTPQPCPHLTGADRHSLWFPLRLIAQRDEGQGLDAWPSVSSPAQGDSSVTQGLLSPYRSREVDNSARVGSRLLCHSWYSVISSLDFCEWWLNACHGWSWMCLSCCQAAPCLLVTPSSGSPSLLSHLKHPLSSTFLYLLFHLNAGPCVVSPFCLLTYLPSPFTRMSTPRREEFVSV